MMGGVALLMGAIGIANVTLVSVMERTGEIGLRRALGASRRHIASQFLIEWDDGIGWGNPGSEPRPSSWWRFPPIRCGPRCSIPWPRSGHRCWVRANGPGFGRLPGDAGREDGAGRSAPIQHLAAPFVVAGSCFVRDDRLILLQ